MGKPILTIISGIIFGLAACSSPSVKPVENGPDSSAHAPVETKSPNSDYKPAFAGQTRIAGVKTKTPYEATVLTSDLKSPWGITSLPDGRLLITEKEGVMLIATVSGQLSAPITGIPKVNSAGQGGLLGLRVDPDFSNNRMVYWVFSEPLTEGNLTSVAKGKLSADEKTIEGATVIYRATPAYKGTLHYGGRIVFDKNGNLIISTGERSDLETRPQAQYLNSALGKVLRITKDGKPAAGNPFTGQNDKRPEIFSYGHRNVQGLAFHPETGDLWETEFGPRGGDELNRIEPGKNYGWPIITYGIEYSGPKVGDGIQQKEGLEQPVYYWDPVISPSGITFYSGSNIPEWKNNLFIGGLSGMHIDRLVIEKNKVVGEERLLVSEEQRFRDITEGKDGALYTITDNGRLYRIHKK
ncbi:Glucose/arabinose dehydrogenase, beta-propeller fold [Chitinophaga sp. CF118]|uniref:PQQ-dependent sugar dehydrogenase n=1 Tax=Chitinophaga sp. CF118 TaxID=1884367 RepID=UPI0008E214D9|nr:PQQ-dependent sugar dehydrogenase [Chitinophaga sp. CF118]SFF10021.1 Glucose/arabinose dehydrogenase, beta-propeller fold [Chitinophaga sp. CF118]